MTVAVLTVLPGSAARAHGGDEDGGFVEPSEPFTAHLRRVGAFALVMLAGLLVLAVLLPPLVGPTPVAGIEVTRPPWIFWWLFTLENWFGLSAILWGSAVLFVILIAVPFIDHSPERYWRCRPVAMIIAGALVIALVVHILR